MKNVTLVRCVRPCLSLPFTWHLW